MRAPLLALLLLLPSLLSSQQPRLSHAAWLEGCWQRTGRTSTMVERWMAATNGVMTGGSWFITDGTRRVVERLRLVETASGITYDAHPTGQARTLFPATSASTTTLVFENPKHDFPQKISYERRGTDSLVVRTEGDRDGRQGPVTFRFRKADCSGIPVP